MPASLDIVLATEEFTPAPQINWGAIAMVVNVPVENLVNIEWDYSALAINYHFNYTQEELLNADWDYSAIAANMEIEKTKELYSTLYMDY